MTSEAPLNSISTQCSDLRNKMPQNRSSDIQIAHLEIKMMDQFNALNTHNSVLAEQMTNLTTIQTKLLETVYGNGKEGLLTKVAKFESKQAIIITLVLALFATVAGLQYM